MSAGGGLDGARAGLSLCALFVPLLLRFHFPSPSHLVPDVLHAPQKHYAVEDEEADHRDHLVVSVVVVGVVGVVGVVVVSRRDVTTEWWLKFY